MVKSEAHPWSPSLLIVLWEPEAATPSTSLCITLPLVQLPPSPAVLQRHNASSFFSVWTCSSFACLAFPLRSVPGWLLLLCQVLCLQRALLALSIKCSCVSFPPRVSLSYYLVISFILFAMSCFLIFLAVDQLPLSPQFVSSTRKKSQLSWEPQVWEKCKQRENTQKMLYLRFLPSRSLWCSNCDDDRACTLDWIILDSSKRSSFN